MTGRGGPLRLDTVLRATRRPWTTDQGEGKVYVLPPGGGPPALLSPPGALVWQRAGEPTSARRLATDLVASGAVSVEEALSSDQFARLVLRQLQELEAAGLVERVHEVA